MKKIISLVLMVVLLLPAASLADSGNLWQIGHYVDEFNEVTGEEFAYIDLTGTFSNSATTNSELVVRIIVDFNDVEFYLLEYGNYKLTSLFNDPTYTIRIKDGSDILHTFTGILSKSTSRIILDTQYRDEMLDVLNAGGKIRFAITDDNSSSTKYNFVINNANNFENRWKVAAGIAVGYMSSFSEGVVTVVNGDKMGALNTAGDVVIPCIYDIVFDCTDGILKVYNGEYIELDGGSRMVNGGVGKYGFISKDGTIICDLEYDNAASFYCGRAFVKKNNKWGCIDTNGKLVIPYQYDYVHSFSEDKALVYTGTLKKGLPDKGVYSFIDLNGNIVFSGMERGFDFSDGLARVVLDGKYGYIDAEGNLVIPAKWDDAGAFNNGRAWVVSDGKVRIIDTTGNVVAECNINNIIDVSEFSDGMAYVWNSQHRYGFINEEGVLVIPCTYTFAGEFQDGYTYVKNENDKYGIIDKAGVFSVPCEWDEIRRVGNYFRVRKYATINAKAGIGVGGTYGLIDAHGNVVLECSYSSINYGEGYYTVSKDTEWIIFDNNLNRIY